MECSVGLFLSAIVLMPSSTYVLNVLMLWIFLIIDFTCKCPCCVYYRPRIEIVHWGHVHLTRKLPIHGDMHYCKSRRSKFNAVNICIHHYTIPVTSKHILNLQTKIHSLPFAPSILLTNMRCSHFTYFTSIIKVFVILSPTSFSF